MVVISHNLSKTAAIQTDEFQQRDVFIPQEWCQERNKVSMHELFRSSWAMRSTMFLWISCSSVSLVFFTFMKENNDFPMMTLKNCFFLWLCFWFTIKFFFWKIAFWKIWQHGTKKIESPAIRKQKRMSCMHNIGNYNDLRNVVHAQHWHLKG